MPLVHCNEIESLQDQAGKLSQEFQGFKQDRRKFKPSGIEEVEIPRGEVRQHLGNWKIEHASCHLLPANVCRVREAARWNG